MGEQIVKQAFSVSDSVFLVLLVGLAVVTVGLIRYVFKKNDEREKRYIEVIQTQADSMKVLDALQHDVKDIKNVVIGGRAV